MATINGPPRPSTPQPSPSSPLSCVLLSSHPRRPSSPLFTHPPRPSSAVQSRSSRIISTARRSALRHRSRSHSIPSSQAPNILPPPQHTQPASTSSLFIAFLYLLRTHKGSIWLLSGGCCCLAPTTTWRPSFRTLQARRAFPLLAPSQILHVFTFL